MKTKNQIHLFAQLAFGLLLLLPGAAFAQGPVWTHTAAACAVDNASASKYETNGARFRFKVDGQTTGNIYARCNITNPKDDGSNPGWNRLEVAYTDERESPNFVKATLYRVNKTSGGVSEIGTAFDSINFGAKPSGGAEEVTLTHTFNFTTYAYFVMLQIHREDASYNPSISAVRLKRVN